MVNKAFLCPQIVLLAEALQAEKANPCPGQASISRRMTRDRVQCNQSAAGGWLENGATSRSQHWSLLLTSGTFSGSRSQISLSERKSMLLGPCVASVCMVSRRNN